MFSAEPGRSYGRKSIGGKALVALDFLFLYTVEATRIVRTPDTTSEFLMFLWFQNEPSFYTASPMVAECGFGPQSIGHEPIKLPFTLFRNSRGHAYSIMGTNAKTQPKQANSPRFGDIISPHGEF